MTTPTLLGPVSTLQPWSEPNEIIFDFTTGVLDERITINRSSDGTYVDADGLVKVASAGQPRFDHDPMTGECIGLLSEGTSTNLVDAHRAWGGGWASSANFFRTPNAGVSPSGAMDATLYGPVSGQGSFDNGVLRYELNMTPGRYTVSAYFKAVGATSTVRLLPYLTPACVTGGVIDLRPGATQGNIIATQFDGGGAYIGSDAVMTTVPMRDGWVRVVLTFACLQAGLFRFRAFPYIGTSQLTGDGSSGLLIWGAQIESRGYVSSLIMTNGAQAQRSSEWWSAENLGSVIDQSQGTLLVEARSLRQSFDANDYFLSLGQSTGSTNSFLIWRANGLLRGYVNSNGTIAQTAGDSQVNIRDQFFRAAYAFAQNDQAMSINGKAVQTASGSLPVVPMNTLRSNVGFDVIFKRAGLLPTRYSNADLRVLSRL